MKKLTHEEFLKRIEKLNPEIKVLEKYIDGTTKILIEDKYGICSIYPTSLLQGFKSSILTAINKTEYFINKLKEKYGDRYDYSLVEYKGTRNKEKITLICPKHGSYDITANNIMQGCHCKKCFQESHNSTWTYTQWEEAGLKSKHFKQFEVYLIKCWNNNEEFYKIGKTFVGVAKRFRFKKDMPYEWELIKSYVGSSRYISELENTLKSKNKEYKYIPLLDFHGKNECFSSLPII